MAFATQQNKALLWNTLNESGCFLGISNSDYLVIKQHFEKSIIQTTNAPNPKNYSTMELNKNFISGFSGYLSQFKQKSVKPNSGLQQIYSSEARSKASTDQFNYALKNKQNERHIEKSTPPEINFNDDSKNGDSPIKDMDAQLAQMMADRKLDIGITKNDRKDAEAWINNGQDRELNSNSKSVSFSDDISNNDHPIHARAAMASVNTSSDNLLSKLKTVPSITIGSSSLGDFSDNKSEILKKIDLIETELKTIKELLQK